MSCELIRRRLSGKGILAYVEFNQGEGYTVTLSSEAEKEIKKKDGNAEITNTDFKTKDEALQWVKSLPKLQDKKPAWNIK